MAAETLGDILRRIGRLAGLQSVLSLTDAQLLERFAVRRDEPAFAALMVRHGPMVLGVCRRLLHDAAAAEDAFQAAFLVLARKAGAIQRRTLLSAWLYGVAYKVAARLRGRAWKRQARETSGADLASLAANIDPEPSELPPLLHQEVQRLPDKYRNPIVLCYLEGKTHEEAALLLHWPLGTVKGRLARARDLLRSRLTRRGVMASEGMMATTLAATKATASARLTDATIRAATRFAAGEGGVDKMASARAIALSQGVLRTMILTKVKIAAALVLTLALLSGGGYTYLSQAAEPKEGPKPGQVASEKPALVDKEKDDKDKPKADEPAPDKQAIQGVWQTTDVEDKGKGQTWDFTAEKVVIQTPGQYDQLNGYTLDSSKTPKEIDLTLKPRKKSQAIYSLEGDVLKIYFAGSPGGPRPTKLAAGGEDKTILRTLKRASTYFEDLVQFDYSGNGPSGTGIRGKGGFTVVTMEAAPGRSKLAVSFAVKEQDAPPDFRVVAVDADGKRMQDSNGSTASAGGNGITVITVVSEFNLSGDKIDSLVIQQRTPVKK